MKQEKTMIYLSAYNALFDGPEVEEPNEQEECYHVSHRFPQRDFKKDLEAYNLWLSSKIPVVGEHSFQDGQKVEEGKDFEIKERWKPLPEESPSSDKMVYQPIFVAIPIQTPKPEARENNEGGSSFELPCDAAFDSSNSNIGKKAVCIGSGSWINDRKFLGKKYTVDAYGPASGAVVTIIGETIHNYKLAGYEGDEYQKSCFVIVDDETAENILKWKIKQVLGEDCPVLNSDMNDNQSAATGDPSSKETD